MEHTLIDTPDFNSENERRAWLAYYDAQALLYAELAEGASSAEQCHAFRDQQLSWIEKAQKFRLGPTAGRTR